MASRRSVFWLRTVRSAIGYVAMARLTEKTVGAIVRMPLGGNWYGYARKTCETGWWFYKLVSRGPLDESQVRGRPAAFYECVTSNMLRRRVWTLIGVDPYDDPDDAWGPPRYIGDFDYPRTLKVLHKGKMRPATVAECKKLETCGCVQSQGSDFGPYMLRRLLKAKAKKVEGAMRVGAPRVVAANPDGAGTTAEPPPPPVESMAEKKFWRVIEAARNAGTSSARRVVGLRQALRRLQPRDVIAFQMLLMQLRNRAYSWELWRAAELIHGGCSDDGFHSFLGWLILEGNKVYNAALGDPDSLATQVRPGQVCECEDVFYVAEDVYLKMSRDPWTTEGVEFSDRPRGRKISDTTLAKRYPKLYAKFA
jgi:hypothetical protein